MITQRDIAVLLALYRYYVLNRPQLQRLCFADDKTGRVTRRRLQVLHAARFVIRQRVIVDHPHLPAPGSIYFLAKRGREIVAEHLGDPAALTAPLQAPPPHHVLHWIAVSDTHIVIDQAIAAQHAVRLDGWINEYDVISTDESAPEKRFRLYTLLPSGNSRLICAPDAAFLLSVAGHSKVFYLEQDRSTSGVRQIAARKPPGYAALAEYRLHRRHFPQASVDTFTVLLIAPTARRRDALRQALSEKPGSALWRFATAVDLTPDSFLHEPIFYPTVGEPVTWVKSGG